MTKRRSKIHNNPEYEFIGKPVKRKSKSKWFKPKTRSGWSKDLPPKKRRAIVLRAHHGDLLSAARSKQALANVTRDMATKRAAKADAAYFYRRYRKTKKR